MNFTSFNPMIITNDSEAAIALFEELGFARQHKKDGFLEDISAVRMKDTNGFYVDVVHAPVPQDMTTIRMNVEDFDEACELLSAHGFKRKSEGKPTETGSSKGCMMVSPSGFSISISKHYK
jgi:adenylate cyclase class IV